MKLALVRALYDPGDPMGKMFFNILATFAEFEADLIRMRTREGMASPALVLQRRFFDLVSFWPEIASRKARPQGCHGRGQVAMKRRSRSLSCEASL